MRSGSTEASEKTTKEVDKPKPDGTPTPNGSENFL